MRIERYAILTANYENSIAYLWRRPNLNHG